MPSRKGAADFYSSTCNSKIANLRIKQGQRPHWFTISQATNPFWTSLIFWHKSQGSTKGNATVKHSGFVKFSKGRIGGLVSLYFKSCKPAMDFFLQTRIQAKRWESGDKDRRVAPCIMKKISGKCSFMWQQLVLVQPVGPCCGQFCPLPGLINGPTAQPRPLRRHHCWEGSFNASLPMNNIPHSKCYQKATVKSCIRSNED